MWLRILLRTTISDALVLRIPKQTRPLSKIVLLATWEPFPALDAVVPPKLMAAQIPYGLFPKRERTLLRIICRPGDPVPQPPLVWMSDLPPDKSKRFPTMKLSLARLQI